MAHTFLSKRLSFLAGSLRRLSDVAGDPSAATALPPPIRVSKTDYAGRGVFATRRIIAGDLIHTAQPFLTHPAVAHMDKVCYLCLKRLNRSQCKKGLGEQKENPDNDFTPLSTEFRSGDHQLESELHISFCCEECYDVAKSFLDVEKKADWSSYHAYCSLKGLKYPLLVKRLSCMVLSGTASAYGLDILQPAPLSPDLISEMDEGFHLLRNALERAGFSNEQLAFLTREWFINVLSRIRINSFRVELIGGSSYDLLMAAAAAAVLAEASVGNAVYILPSFYNHDCDPNAHIIWINNSNARLTALSDIEPEEERYLPTFKFPCWRCYIFCWKTGCVERNTQACLTRISPFRSVWPYSGHYRPTEQNFQEFVSFLEENGVDLQDVKKSPEFGQEEISIERSEPLLRSNSSEPCLSMDEESEHLDEEWVGKSEIQPSKGTTLDDYINDLMVAAGSPATERSGYVIQKSQFSGCSASNSREDELEEAREQHLLHHKRNLFDEEEEIAKIEVLPKESILQRINSKKGIVSYQLGEQLSCKWTTGAGPRIGFVRDHPSELQFRALEQVHLSPRSTANPSRFASSPQPSF